MLLENVDLCLAATGRKPKLQGLGLEKAGVKIDEKTGELLQTTKEKQAVTAYMIYRTSAPKLTPVALEQGHCFADTFYGGKMPARLGKCRYGRLFISKCCTVGLTEEDAGTTWQSCLQFQVYATENHIKKSRRLLLTEEKIT